MKKSILCLAVSLLSLQSFADSGLILKSNTFNPALTLPAPPQDNSIEAVAERSYIKSVMQNATSSDLAAAKKDAEIKNVSYLSDTIPHFDLDNLPKTKNLFDIVAKNERNQTEIFKDYFNRKRPYQVDESIVSCSPPREKDLNASDPSGHTTMAFTVAIIMANLLPDYGQEILHRAEIYGQHRIVCGAHHPFDVRSGQVLGTLIGEKLLNTKELQQSLLDAKNELNAVIPKKTHLVGTDWKTIFINAKAIEGVQPTLIILDDKVSGFAGCNRFSANVSRGNSYDQISFSQPLTTKMSCNYNQTETDFLKYLSVVVGYTINDKMLILKDAKGNNVLEFLAQ